MIRESVQLYRRILYSWNILREITRKVFRGHVEECTISWNFRLIDGCSFYALLALCEIHIFDPSVQ